MQLRQAWMRDEVKDQGHEPLSFVRSARVGDPPEGIAQRMRQVLQFGDNWAEQEPTWTQGVRRLREAIEDARILVAVNGIVGNNTHRKLNPGEFRGFVLVDDYAPLVFVNNSDGKAAQMFTLAHEFAHVFFGSSRFRPSPVNAGTRQDRVGVQSSRGGVPCTGEPARAAWPAGRGTQRPFQAIAIRNRTK